MLRVLNAKFLAVFVLIVVGLSCSGLDFQETAKDPEKELVNLPSGLTNQWEFQEAADESAVILLLTSDNELYQEQMQIVKDPLFDLNELKSTTIDIAREELPGILKSVIVSEVLEKKIVYLKVDSGATFDIVVPLFRSIRDAGITSVGLLTEKKPDWSAGYKGLFEVQLEVPIPHDIDTQPYPFVLIAVLEEDGGLRLNYEEQGTIADTRDLEKRLSDVFRDRTERRILRPGSNEIEKSVYVGAFGSSKYSDVMKLIDALKGSGAEPIVIALEQRLFPTMDLEKDDSQENTNIQEE